eukprot:6702243-Pyramimonas_sp.AAC.1
MELIPYGQSSTWGLLPTTKQPTVVLTCALITLHVGIDPTVRYSCGQLRAARTSEAAATHTL